MRPLALRSQGEDGEGPAPEMSRGGYGGGAKLKWSSKTGSAEVRNPRRRKSDMKKMEKEM